MMWLIVLSIKCPVLAFLFEKKTNNGIICNPAIADNKECLCRKSVSLINTIMKSKIKPKHVEIVKDRHWTLKKKLLYPEHTEHSVSNIFWRTSHGVLVINQDLAQYLYTVKTHVTKAGAVNVNYMQCKLYVQHEQG